MLTGYTYKLCTGVRIICKPQGILAYPQPALQEKKEEKEGKKGDLRSRNKTNSPSPFSEEHQEHVTISFRCASCRGLKQVDAIRFFPKCFVKALESTPQHQHLLAPAVCITITNFCGGHFQTHPIAYSGVRLRRPRTSLLRVHAVEYNNVGVLETFQKRGRVRSNCACRYVHGTFNHQVAFPPESEREKTQRQDNVHRADGIAAALRSQLGLLRSMSI